MTNISDIRIFEGLINNHEKTDILLSFLKSNEHKLDLILKHCYNFQDLYTLDYIFKYSLSNIKVLYDFIAKLNIENHIRLKIYMQFLLWKLIKMDTKYNKNLSNKINFDLKLSLIDKLNKNLHLTYPHSFGALPSTVGIDNYILKNYYPGIINGVFHSMSNDNFSNYISDINHSLLIFDILTFDVYDNLSYEKKLLMLFHIPNGAWQAENFLIQIIDKAKTIDEKKISLDLLKKQYSYEYEDSHPIVKFLDCDCFSQLYMMLHIDTESDYMIKDIILELLKTSRIDFLVDWINFDKNDLDAHLNISNFVQYIKNNVQK